MNLDKFEKNIGYTFKDKNLLRNALTHTSYAYENKVKSNERLEFLGDAILEFVITEYLFNLKPAIVEGEMTKVRAAVVCEKSLYEISLKHNFGDFLFLGKSEIANGGKTRPALLADSVEALIGAIYIDSGLESVKQFIIENLKQIIENSVRGTGIKDYKTMLQERLQVNGDVSIEYIVIDEKGPDHDKVFTVSLKCQGKELAIGEGKTKKEAEMEAARKALSE